MIFSRNGRERKRKGPRRHGKNETLSSSKNALGNPVTLSSSQAKPLETLRGAVYSFLFFLSLDFRFELIVSRSEREEKKDRVAQLVWGKDVIDCVITVNIENICIGSTFGTPFFLVNTFDILRYWSWIHSSPILMNFGSVCLKVRGNLGILICESVDFDFSDSEKLCLVIDRSVREFLMCVSIHPQKASCSQKKSWCLPFLREVTHAARSTKGKELHTQLFCALLRACSPRKLF